MRYRDRNESYKIKWQGRIQSIQPRTRVWRYVTDNRTHYHLGYNMFIVGNSEEHPEKLEVDETLRDLPQMGAEGSALYHPVNSKIADADWLIE